MKNLSPRQKEIIKLVSEKGELSVGDIQKALGISQATAYREIQTLAQLRLLAKIPGGVGRLEHSSTHCVQCGRENNPRSAFLFEQKNGKQFTACCSHCGLMALANRADVSLAMTTDFFYGTMLNARQAWYVLDSDVSLCCRPSILSFSNRTDAERFVKGFNGEVISFTSAQSRIKAMMKL